MSFPDQIITIPYSDLVSLNATTRPYLSLNGSDAQYKVTNTFDSDVLAVAGSTASIVPSRTNDLVRSLTASATPSAGEVVFLSSLGPDVVSNDFSASDQAYARVHKLNSDGESDFSLLVFQSEPDASKPMSWSNGSGADPLTYLPIRFNGAWVDGTTYWEIPISIEGSGAGTASAGDSLLWGVLPRNRIQDQKDWSANTGSNRPLYYDGSDVTSLPPTGQSNIGFYYSIGTPADTVISVIDTWVKVAGTSTFGSADQWSNDSGVSNRAKKVGASLVPQYKVSAHLCAKNQDSGNKSYEFAFAVNGSIDTKSIQAVSLPPYEVSVAVSTVWENPPDTEYIEVYARNRSDTSDLRVSSMFVDGSQKF